MYWNDRLDVQIEICLITQAAAIVEIELKGTLTRPRPGSASLREGSGVALFRRLAERANPACTATAIWDNATGISVAARGLPMLLFRTELPLCVTCSWRREGFWRDSANNSFDRPTLMARASLPGNS